MVLLIFYLLQVLLVHAQQVAPGDVVLLIVSSKKRKLRPKHLNHNKLLTMSIKNKW